MSSLSELLSVRRKCALALPLVMLAFGPTAAFAAKARAQSADLATTIVSPTITTAGSYLYYTITVTNNGPDPASGVVISDATPSSWNLPRIQPTTFDCVASGTAWCGPLSPDVACKTPTVGSTGTISCTTASLSPSASLTLTIVVHVGFYLHNQAVVDTATTTSRTFDPNTANNMATVSARVS